MWQRRKGILGLVGFLASTLIALLSAEAMMFRPPTPQAPAKPAPPVDNHDWNPPPLPKRDVMRRLTTPGDAVALALSVIGSVQPADQPFLRFLWVQSGSIQEAKTTSAAMNLVSRAPLPIPLQPAAGGNLMVVDLRLYFAKELNEDYAADEGLQEAIRTWEDLQFDPLFNELVTHDELGNLGDPHRGSSVDVVRVDGPHLDQAAYTTLKTTLHTNAPIFRASYFIERALTTIKDDGDKQDQLYATLYGGRYYEFSGIHRHGQVKGAEKATDLDVLFDDLGIGNIKAGLTYNQLYDRLESDQRAAMYKSGVTGHKRAVVVFHGPQERGGTGLVAVTEDIDRKRIDIDFDPFANLLTHKVDAFEVLFNRANGFQGGAIFDGKQNLLDETAASVVQDRDTRPNPSSPQLESGISCIGCHWRHGESGWKPVKNDLPALFRQVDVFGERDIGGSVINREAGLFTGDFEHKVFPRARDDLEEAVLRATGPWPDASKDQTNVVQKAAEHLVEGYQHEKYDLVDAAAALADLGVHIPPADAVRTFQAVFPPDLNAFAGNRFAETSTIAALKAGLSVPRTNWELEYAFDAVRSQRAISVLREKVKP